MFSRDRLYDLLALVACGVALAVALRTVSGLAWPYDGDHYRDIAQAQATLDGHPLADPHYASETLWYNPLVPWLVAAGAALFDAPPATAHVQGAPWLNLLAPIGFYVLGAALAGRGAAFVALVIFLFFNGRTEPALTTPTYSSWLFVATFAQGLFYLSLAAMSRVAARPTDLGAGAVGVLAGLTFLAHTAPALILGACALVLLGRRHVAIAGLAALVVASPFLYSIVWHYHLHVVNATPMAWNWLPVTLTGMPGTLRANALLIAAGLAGLAVVRHRAMLAWLMAAAVLLVLALARDRWPAIPALVPAFHFWRYTLAALILLAGAVVAWGCQRVAGRHVVWLTAAVATAAVLWMLPQYRQRFDFVFGRAIALERDPNHAAMTAFLHKSTPDGAVVLGNRGASLQIIGPAGRKVVAVNGNWSNPYVDNAVRVRDRDAMLDALARGDEAGFEALANQYGVTHLVGTSPDECSRMAGAGRQLLYRFGDTCAFMRVR